MIYIDNQFGFDYLSKLYVDDQIVFCIEPMQLFVDDMPYTENSEDRQITLARRQKIIDSLYSHLPNYILQTDTDENLQAV